MKGLFCSECKARNNEEFRQVLKKRARNLWILFGIGICTAIAGFAAGYFWVDILPRQIGMVAGLGTGVVVGSMFYEPCMVVCCLLIMFFLIGYMAFRRYYENVI